MAIGNVDLNVAMTRIQDYTTQKHSEDIRGDVQNEQMNHHFTKELKEDMKQVVKTDQTEYQNKTRYQNKKFDAKEQGSNQYTGNGGKGKKGKDQSGKGTNGKQSSGFDIKI